jgi:hypothetical protein
VTRDRAPANRYLLDGGLRLPHTNRVSGGIDQRLPGRCRPASPTHTTRRLRFRGLNLNPPVDGVRPIPASATSSRWCPRGIASHEVQFSMTVNPGALIPAFNAPLINWKRATVFTNYTWTNLENNWTGRSPSPPPAAWRRSGDGVAGNPAPVQLHVQQSVRQELPDAVELQHERRLRTIRTGFDEAMFPPPPHLPCSGGSRRGCRRASREWRRAGAPTVQTFDQNAARFRCSSSCRSRTSPTVRTTSATAA